MVIDPPSTPQGEARRDEIIHQAISVFGESGFGGGRIDDVAERVGIRRPSVLYHFPDKATLYSAAIGEVVADLANRVDLAQNAPHDPLDSIADAWVDFVIDRPDAARLLLRQMIDANPTPIESAAAPTQRLIDVIRSAIEEQAGPVAAKALDAAEFSLVLASTSLVWVASRSAVVGALGLDTLSAAAVQRHRRTLHSLIRQLIAASQEAHRANPKREGKKLHSADSPGSSHTTDKKVAEKVSRNA